MSARDPFFVQSPQEEWPIKIRRVRVRLERKLPYVEKHKTYGHTVA
jgi:hypothetical protein